MNSKKRSLPDLNTLSVFIGTILLSYTLTHFVRLPGIEIHLRVLGIYLPLRLNFPLFVSLLVTGLVASGTTWVLKDHPAIDQDQLTVEHWLLPGLTSLVLLLLIEQVPFGLYWWIAAALSGVILLFVLLAEYIAVDPGNDYYPLAEAGITALALAFFLMLAIALHAEGVRLFYRVPVLSLSAAFVYLRVLHLRLERTWAIIPAGITLLIIGELSAGLHYWPMNSISFGIALLGPLYALIDIGETFNTEEMDSPLRMFLIPSIIVAFSWLVAFYI